VLIIGGDNTSKRTILRDYFPFLSVRADEPNEASTYLMAFVGANAVKIVVTDAT